MQITLLKKSTIAAAAIAVSMMAGGASAATLVATFDGNDPDFPGSGASGNDPFGSGFLAEDGFAIEGMDLITPSLAKCDADASDGLTCPDDDWENGSETANYAGAFTLTYNLDSDTNFYTVDWTFNPELVADLGSAELLFPHYVAVKQSQFFNLWELDDDERLGGSIATGLSGISHVSFYNTGDVTPIPLPAAGWLLLAGIGGLAAFRRRKSV